MVPVDIPREAFDRALVQTCGRGGATPAGASGLTRTPYLQKVTPDAVEILFTTWDAIPATVTLDRPDGEAQRVTTQTWADLEHFDTVLHVARFERLEPDTLYCYRIARDDAPWWESTGFRTAPGPTSVVRFVTLGDLGTRTPDQYAVATQLAATAHDFVLVTGDVAYPDGRPEDLERNVFSMYGPLMASVPFFPATGNHDHRTDDAAPFHEAFASFDNGGPHAHERWFSFDWGPVHVVVLDTEALDRDQLRWLDADLAATRQPWSVVVTHRPPYSTGEHGSDRRTRRRLAPILEAHGADLVLSGHDHDYERTHPVDGVHYVVTGGGGVGTRSVGQAWFTAYSARVAHFVHVTADPQHLVLAAVDATGVVFDSLLLAR